MTPTPPISKDQALDTVRERAREYFANRDALEGSRVGLLDAVVAANTESGATQHQIADACYLVNEPGATEDWQFHRTRIQQFLNERAE